MSQWYDVRRFDGRLIILFSTVGLSFLRYLLGSQYGLLYPEVVVAVGVFAFLCALLALVSGKLFVFNFLILILILAWSTNTIHLDFFPEIRFRWIIVALGGLVGGAMYFMREKFYYAMLIFNLAAFGVDVAQASFVWPTAPPGNSSSKNRSHLSHVLYLILDGHIGLQGFPKDIPECREAKETVRNMFLENNFRIYPYAFSNYSSTFDSISSILTDSLLERTNDYAKQNRLFERYLARDYDVRIYQSDYYVVSFAGTRSLSTYTYKAHGLKALHLLGMSWRSRLREILVIYLQSDELWRESYQRLMPARFQVERLRMGPLSVVGVWPKLLADLRDARQNTLFFAHLLTPHYPHVYKKDGTIRDPLEWRSDFRRVESYRRSTYTEQYRRYSSQVQFLAGQLASFFQHLREMGLYDSMTVIVHGDHGSRIRLLKAAERREREKLRLANRNIAPAIRYDYLSEPELQDLLNRFSSLLAVKLLGAKRPEVIDEKGSVLYLLRGFFLHEKPARTEYKRLNSVYLFDGEGMPRGIPLLKLWQKEADEQ